MHNHTKHLDYFQRTVDLLIVLISWCIAYYLKFVFDFGGDTSTKDYSSEYIAFAFLLVIVSLITFKNLKIYNSVRFEHISKEIFAQVKANIVSFAVFLIIAFFISRFRLSRVVLVSYFFISTFLLCYSKYFFRKLIEKTPAQLVLVGDGAAIVEYYNKVKKLKNFSIQYWVNPPSDIPAEVKIEKEIHYKDLEKEKTNVVVLGYDLSESEKLDRVLKNLSELLIPVIVLPDLQYSKLGHSFRDFKGQTLLYINDPNAKTANMFLKRVFDFSATAIGMILISPLLAILALLVKLSSKGPIFYGQVRMGVDGKEFKMWKFRSMVTGSANHGGWTVENDPRVTPLGRFLRKSNLDELPQLWNVIVGDMSLVGPRPERPQYVEKFREDIPSYMLRHKFKAGITGWAQVNGWRGDTSIEKRIECDLWYIRNWSLTLDFYILFMTFFKGNKNAY